MSKPSIPFYSNSPDDTHCFQAVLKMLLKYYYPVEEYTWDELDEISAKKPNLYTWPYAGLLFLQNKGLTIQVIEQFNHQKFIKEGGQYLIDEYGKEVGQTQIKNSNINAERRRAKKFIKQIEIEQRAPTITDIKKMLDQNYLVGVNLNARALNQKPGYSGHFVLIFDYDKKHLIVHDPGLPAFENRRVPIKTFKTAWAYPNKKAQNLTAFKK